LAAQVEALTASTTVPALVPTESVSSNVLPVSLGAVNIVLNTQVPLSGSVLPMHLLGSSHAKLAPLLSAIDLTSTEPLLALIVTFLDATPSASTTPNSTGDGDSVGASPISVSVIALAVPSPVAELVVPPSLPLIDEQPPDPVSGIGSDSSQRKFVIVPEPLRSATTNLAGVHTALNVGSLSDSCIADAELQASARSDAVTAAATSSRRTRLRTGM
jgi:hypothetical protein